MAAGSSDVVRGTVCGLAAAALFGASTPAAKWLLGTVDPQILAGLFYFAAGIALSVYRAVRPAKQEAPLRRTDLPLLAGIVLAGGVAGPLLLLVGLMRTTATASALLLNLEAPFTMAIALIVFGEHLPRRGLVAALLILLGSAVLKVRPGEVGGDSLGMLAVAGACAAWAIDNNLTQRLALRDPVSLVRIKAVAAGAMNLGIGFARGEGLPPPRPLVVACLVGAASYGVSIVLDTYALRWLGAAREAALFATAPFAGAVASVVLLREPIAAVDALAGAIMAAGVIVLLRDRHAHRHRHEAIEHEHSHVHDEHHQHHHDGDIDPTEPHTHLHRHEALEHDHPHVSDLHHRHEH